MLWFIFLLMLFIAGIFIVLPIIKRGSVITSYIYISFLFICCASSILYYYLGNPLMIDEEQPVMSIDAITESLEQRLDKDPNDIEGWRILANTYSFQKQFPNAFEAYEKVINLESESVAQTFSDYGESLVQSGNAEYLQKANEMFERALKIDVNDTKSLFYGGISAVSVGNPLLGAERWERLLALSPPNDIRNTLEEKIKEWRGGDNKSLSEINDEFTVQLNISTKVLVELDNYPDKVLYLIARDPLKPSPPIAAIRKDVVSGINIIDSSAIMLPGLKFSNFEEIEIIARISLTGDPLDRDGDYMDSLVIKTTDTNLINLNIE